MSSSLRKAARDHLLAFVANQEASGDHIAVDVWRVLQEESKLLYETQCIRDLIDQDPFQCYKDAEESLKQAVQQFQRSIQVTSCHRVEKDDDYCYNEAIVQYRNCGIQNSNTSSSSPSAPLTKKQKRQQPKKQNEFVQLYFRYERIPATSNQETPTPTHTSTPTCLYYTIDMSQNYGPKQNIVTIRCWADGNKPSKLPAVSIEDNEDGSGDDDDDREDIDDDEEEIMEIKQDAANTNDKKGTVNEKTTGSNAKASEKPEEEKDNNKHDEEEPPDRYACFVDPDVLQKFQTCTQLTAMDQATAFLTLMSFPFYQHEWDLVGFVLDSVFGYGEEEEEEEEED